MKRPKKEKAVKLAVGDWLKGLGCGVYDEVRNDRRPNWDGTFQVRNIQRARKPDLVISCRMPKADNVKGRRSRGIYYVALEVKPGYKHPDIVSGFEDVLQYFSDYCWGARYSIKGKGLIRISVIALATYFSRDGFLWTAESAYGLRRVEGVSRRIHAATFSFCRLLSSQRLAICNRLLEMGSIPGAEKRIEKGLNLRELPEVGVLIGDTEAKPRHSALLMTSETPYYWPVLGLD